MTIISNINKGRKPVSKHRSGGRPTSGGLKWNPKRVDKVYPVGNTVLPVCVQSKSGISTRNSERLVLTVLKLATSGLEVKASIAPIVESLIWIFVCKRSVKAEWFSDKEFRRFVSSMRYTANNLNQYQSQDNREQTFCKYWLDGYLCRCFKDDQRPVREPWITTPLFKGWCRRFVLRAIARRDFAVIYSLQKGAKRMWPKLGPLKEAASLQKHMERLSVSHGDLPSDLEWVIRRTAQVVFKDSNRWDAHNRMTKFLPSKSACLQASRRDGGALGMFSPLKPFKSRGPGYYPGPLQLLDHDIESWRSFHFKECVRVAEETLVESEEEPSCLEVEVLAIPEPGKFRIITKGCGYLYSALQPVQGLLLSDWKKFHASTMEDADLTWKVRMIDQNVDASHWCSVDYEAATDLLKRSATHAVIKSLEDLPMHTLALRSLGAGYASYPDGSRVLAIDGQLMGHPLSFPILCAINYSVYLCAIQRWEWEVFDSGGDPLPEKEKRRRVRLAKSMRKNVIVNGDDMLFKCSPEFYPVFVQTAADAGFKISQGKQYLSPDAGMINSQVFFRNRFGIMDRIGYLNLQLIKTHSLKKGESLALPTQISRDLAEMVDNCPWALSAIPAAFNRWKGDFFGSHYHPNWYIPVHLGGYGLPLKYAPEGRVRMTRLQREMAAHFIANPALALYRTKGIVFPKLLIGTGALAKWRWDDFDDEDIGDPEVEDSWLNRLALAAQMMNGGKGEDFRAFPLIRKTRFQHKQGLRPVTKEKLLEYWNARFVASCVPGCPQSRSLGLVFLKYREEQESSWEEFVAKYFVRHGRKRLTAQTLFGNLFELS